MTQRVFGDQLVGFSPKLCRQLLRALRQKDEEMGGEKRVEKLPRSSELSFRLLMKQVNNEDFPWENFHRPEDRKGLLWLLNQIDDFLSNVEK